MSKTNYKQIYKNLKQAKTDVKNGKVEVKIIKPVLGSIERPKFVQTHNNYIGHMEPNSQHFPRSNTTKLTDFKSGDDSIVQPPSTDTMAILGIIGLILLFATIWVLTTLPIY
jgi:hypothetical protein